MGAGHAAHIEQRIVGQGRADADHDGIDIGTQAMQMVERAVTIDPTAFAVQGGAVAREVARRAGDGDPWPRVRSRFAWRQ